MTRVTSLLWLHPTTHGRRTTLWTLGPQGPRPLPRNTSTRRHITQGTTELCKHCEAASATGATPTNDGAAAEAVVGGGTAESLTEVTLAPADAGTLIEDAVRHVIAAHGAIAPLRSHLNTDAVAPHRLPVPPFSVGTITAGTTRSRRQTPPPTACDGLTVH